MNTQLSIAEASVKLNDMKNEIMEDSKKLKEENKKLKEENDKLKENVFNADCRCNQFRVKVGYSFIHDILQDVYLINIDSYDEDESPEPDIYHIKYGFEDVVFSECSNAVNNTINKFIKNPVGEINENIIDEIGEVVESFIDSDIIYY